MDEKPSAPKEAPTPLPNPPNSQNSTQNPEIFNSSNKMGSMLKKVDEARRNDSIKKAKTLDFFEDPIYIKNAKKDIQAYVTSTNTIGEKLIHFMNIFRQFSNKYNQANQLYNPNLTNIFKTKRIEYVTTMPRFSLDEELEERMQHGEKAENTLVNELKLWGHKYALLCGVMGVNLSALLYVTLFKYHNRFLRVIFSATFGWTLSTYLLNKALDKIYYPILPIFEKYRAMEKKYDPEFFKKIATFEKDIEKTKNV